MNLKRDVKILALKTVLSSSGSSPMMAAPILRMIRQGYGPFSGGSSGEKALPAVACISVDFDVTVSSRFEDNRKGTLALVELARRYRVPITWAVCGESAENDMKSYSALADTGGQDEVGVHTYSHIDATKATADEFRSDLERCLQVLGLDSPATLVFPWNRENHFEVLRQMGFRVFRGKARAIGNPVLKGGLWNVRPVYYMDRKSFGGEELVRKYIDVCAALSAPFHLWTHPWSIVSGGNADQGLRTLESVFEYIVEKRKAAEMTTATLGELASTLDSATGRPTAREAPKLEHDATIAQ